MSPILIETRYATSANLADFLDLLRGCWKCSSILWMQSNGFPVLPGVILKGWTHYSEAALSRFYRQVNFTELLVRIEKPGQRWTRRRGGYTLPIDKIRGQVEELADEGIIAILLEPASPYMDVYSLTSVCDLESGKADVEVVGPGFDASDILRADVLPHERFEISFGSKGPKNAATSSFSAKRTHVVGHAEYQTSVHRRLAKIGARLQNPQYPDEVLSANTSDAKRQELADSALNFLQASEQTILLDHAKEYEPIPPRLFTLFVGELRGVLARIMAQQIRWRTLSLAASFLRQDRLVIWDFFPPGENDTSPLFGN